MSKKEKINKRIKSQKKLLPNETQQKQLNLKKTYFFEFFLQKCLTPYQKSL